MGKLKETKNFCLLPREWQERDFFNYEFTRSKREPSESVCGEKGFEKHADLQMFPQQFECCARSDFAHGFAGTIFDFEFLCERSRGRFDGDKNRSRGNAVLVVGSSNACGADPASCATKFCDLFSHGSRDGFRKNAKLFNQFCGNAKNFCFERGFISDDSALEK